MIALILGVTGQDGSLLSKFLINKGYKVVGAARRTSSPTDWRLNELGVKSHPMFTLCSGDITDQASIDRILKQYQPDEIYNLAAQSFVGSSWDTPISTIDITGLGAIRVFESVRNNCPTAKVYQACHDMRTKIVTPTGIKSIEEIKIGDLVYTINEITKEFELCPVDKILKYNYNGDMIVINNRRINQCVTPNHKVLLMHDNGSIIKDNAENVTNILKYNGTSELSISFVTNNNNISPKFIVFDNYIDNNKIKTYKNDLEKMDYKDFCYLLGLYIGDGYIHKRKNIKVLYRGSGNGKRDSITGRWSANDINIKTIDSNYESNYICYCIPEKDKARNKLINTLLHCGLEFTCHSNTVELSSYQLSRIFEMCGTYANNKQIPSFIFSLSTELQLCVLDGLIDSDGCYRDNRESRNYTTVSEQLLVDIIRLCSMCKLYCSFIEVNLRKSMFKGREIKCHKCYSINISKKRTNKIYKHNISKKIINDTVWCLQMKNNHNFMISRDGKIAFSGNSSSEMFGGTENYMPLNEHAPFCPRSPYGVAKVMAHNAAQVWRKSFGLKISCGILFNHEGPYRGIEFVTRKITDSVARIKMGIQKELHLGNLDAVRDWGSSEDYVKAMWMMLQKDWCDDYVIATGQAHSVRDFCKIAFDYVNLNYLDYVKTDENFIRPNEVCVLLGHAYKAKINLGWKPIIPFGTMVKQMVQKDLERLSK